MPKVTEATFFGMLAKAAETVRKGQLDVSDPRFTAALENAGLKARGKESPRSRRKNPIYLAVQADCLRLPTLEQLHAAFAALEYYRRLPDVLSDV